jgi:Tol biopolymer transport system component
MMSGRLASEGEPGRIHYPDEPHLANIRQLTFGGQNAEAYFSFDGGELIFQATRGEHGCDAIYRMNADGTRQRQVSSGEGATTCAFISPDNASIIYASTQRHTSNSRPRRASCMCFGEGTRAGTAFNS